MLKDFTYAPIMMIKWNNAGPDLDVWQGDPSKKILDV